MHRRVAPFAVFSLLLAAAGVASPSEERAADEAAVRAALQAGCEAFRQGDVDALRRFLDERFTLTSSRGEVTNLEQNLAEVKARDPLYEVFDNHDMTVRFYGDTAIVHGITTLKGTSRGKPFAADVKFTDTLVKRGGRWILVTSHASPLAEP